LIKGKKLLAGTRAYRPLPPLLTSTSHVTNNSITSQKKKLHASLSMTQLNKMCNFFLIVIICKIFLLFVEIWKTKNLSHFAFCQNGIQLSEFLRYPACQIRSDFSIVPTMSCCTKTETAYVEVSGSWTRSSWEFSISHRSTPPSTFTDSRFHCHQHG
jgi:hypothetical protein